MNLSTIASHEPSLSFLNGQQDVNSEFGGLINHCLSTEKIQLCYAQAEAVAVQLMLNLQSATSMIHRLRCQMELDVWLNQVEIRDMTYQGQFEQLKSVVVEELKLIFRD
ncbi:hypothetical protein [Pleionea sp. CnH1-48]|uniref:hypothetical protein n=1 Tax=Pleionea sp. CnH1-48 TaxID=2954494 RepID=UPI00209748D7|nr:hypothetical protein [Pleionea sp. CnH1-48]MCO7224716.1 hypothetical protein [Pleionea sp. CnH1-48]